MKRALLLIANGSEEMEAVITSDILSRSKIQVMRVSVCENNDLIVTCANGLKIQAEMSINSLKVDEVLVK
jgi:hypothetical protein